MSFASGGLELGKHHFGASSDRSVHHQQRDGGGETVVSPLFGRHTEGRLVPLYRRRHHFRMPLLKSALAVTATMAAIVMLISLCGMVWSRLERQQGRRLSATRAQSTKGLALCEGEGGGEQATGESGEDSPRQSSSSAVLAGAGTAREENSGASQGTQAGLSRFGAGRRRSTRKRKHPEAASTSSSGSASSNDGQRLELKPQTSGDSSDDPKPSTSAESIQARLPALLHPRSREAFDPNRAMKTPISPKEGEQQLKMLDYLLSRAILRAEEEEELVVAAERVLAHLVTNETTAVSELTVRGALRALSHRYHCLKSLVSALHVLEKERSGKWWERLIQVVPHSYQLSGGRPVDDSVRELVCQLTGALETLKAGNLPSDEVVTKVRALLFSLP